jgi:hypothetical protein
MNSKLRRFSSRFVLVRLLFLVYLVVDGSPVKANGYVRRTSVTVTDGPAKYWKEPYGGHVFLTKQEACTDVGLHVLGGGVVASFVSFGPDSYTPRTSQLWALCTVRDPRNGAIYEYFIVGLCEDLRYASWNGTTGYCRANQLQCPAYSSVVSSTMQCLCDPGHEPNGSATKCVASRPTTDPVKKAKP